jgi:ABC-type Fe2+-enterobactin transport system substrate-binding protein
MKTHACLEHNDFLSTLPLRKGGLKASWTRFQTNHHFRKEKAMIRRSYLLVLVPLLLHIGIASAQESYPIMEKVAEKVIQKYQTSSCQDLAKQKGQRPTGQKAQIEQRVMELLRSDPQMRTEFLNRVAAPIANKLFECGMIP